MRLQAFLARAGAAPSRRKAEAVISSGRVTVNGSVAPLGSSVSEGDSVLLDGERVTLPETSSYFLLNKPAGYLTTMEDDRGRSTIAELFPDEPGLVPVGRLDYETTGAILVTNDGDFAHLIAHPSGEIPKEYRLTLRNPAPKHSLDDLASGPTLEDGPMLPPKLSRIEAGSRTTTLHMTIHEGRNRIIRRACRAVGLHLLALERVRIGSVRLGNLPPGSSRPLSGSEVGDLLKSARTSKPSNTSNPPKHSGGGSAG